MPYADPERRRIYQREWLARRRAEWLVDKVCIECGATADLEIDHVEPDKKIDHRVFSWARARREAELAKCVVRCRFHHLARHAAQRRRHGIGGYKRRCRCDTCVAAKKAGRRRETRWVESHA